MAAVRHLGFIKFNFLKARVQLGDILHHRTKFRKDRLNRCGDIAIFVIFTARCYASAVLAMGLCLSVCVCVCHKSEFY